MVSTMELLKVESDNSDAWFVALGLCQQIEIRICIGGQTNCCYNESTILYLSHESSDAETMPL